jgi:LysR family transcriptional regulator, transcriptional activator of the cysJI operon
LFTLTQLETFQRLARLGSFSRTAQELGITQPAVTRQVRLLEALFGLPLVEIVNRQARVTAAGAFLAERAEQILGNAAALRREMHDFSDGVEGTLEIGATVTIGNYTLPAQLARFQARYPNVVLKVEVGNTVTILQRLRSGRLGLALVEGSVPGADFEVIPYFKDDLVLVVPAAGHRLSMCTSVTPSELSGETLILREEGSGTRSFIERAFRYGGLQPKSIIGLQSAEAAANAVEANLGIAILSSVAAQPAVRGGRLRALSIESMPLSRWFQLVKLKNHHLAPSAERFAALVRAERS